MCADAMRTAGKLTKPTSRTSATCTPSSPTDRTSANASRHALLRLACGTVGSAAVGSIACWMTSLSNRASFSVWASRTIELGVARRIRRDRTSGTRKASEPTLAMSGSRPLTSLGDQRARSELCSHASSPQLEKSTARASHSTSQSMLCADARVGSASKAIGN